MNLVLADTLSAPNYCQMRLPHDSDSSHTRHVVLCRNGGDTGTSCTLMSACLICTLSIAEWYQVAIFFWHVASTALCKPVSETVRYVMIQGPQPQNYLRALHQTGGPASTPRRARCSSCNGSSADSALQIALQTVTRQLTATR